VPQERTQRTPCGHARRGGFSPQKHNKLCLRGFSPMPQEIVAWRQQGSAHLGKVAECRLFVPIIQKIIQTLETYLELRDVEVSPSCLLLRLCRHRLGRRQNPADQNGQRTPPACGRHLHPADACPLPHRPGLLPQIYCHAPARASEGLCSRRGRSQEAQHQHRRCSRHASDEALALSSPAMRLILRQHRVQSVPSSVSRGLPLDEILVGGSKIPPLAEPNFIDSQRLNQYRGRNAATQDSGPARQPGQFQRPTDLPRPQRQRDLMVSCYSKCNVFDGLLLQQMQCNVHQGRGFKFANLPLACCAMQEAR
jgi:hypothetical protein